MKWLQCNAKDIIGRHSAVFKGLFRLQKSNGGTAFPKMGSGAVSSMKSTGRCSASELGCVNTKL